MLLVVLFYSFNHLVFFSKYVCMCVFDCVVLCCCHYGVIRHDDDIVLNNSQTSFKRKKNRKKNRTESKASISSRRQRCGRLASSGLLLLLLLLAISRLLDKRHWLQCSCRSATHGRLSTDRRLLADDQINADLMLLAAVYDIGPAVTVTVADRTA